MKRACAVALVAAVACASAAPRCGGAATMTLADAAVVAPIDALVAGIDAGRSRDVANAYADAPTITDEFAPFVWRGPDAAKRWNAAFVRMVRDARIDRIRVTHGRPSYVVTSPGHAWLVVPTTFRYRANGKMQRETAAWTFALARATGRWRIVTSTWAKTSDTAS